jgi:protein-glutamine gamma-glutamyltransferase
LLGEEAVDDFLFRTRSGYCEHYASAFTFLMRAAGIPARVVVGYQGGDRNPLGDYFVIRQYHAHAWSEVWLEETGWTRVDPTTVLAPERIDVGAGALVPNIDMPRVLSSREVGWVINAWRGLTQGWDAANTLWNQWVLDFGFERQRRFLERFGLAGTTRLERFGHLALALSLSFVAAALVYGVILLRSRPPEDALDKIYARFCRRLAKIGIPRFPQEGPRDYGLRAAGLRPDLAEPIRAIGEGYIRLRYGASTLPGRDAPGASSPEAQQRELARMVRAFRPRRA